MVETYARLVLDGGGNLYGTTNSGGDLTCPHAGPGCGVVFKLSATGKETVLYTFRGGADGGHPLGGLVQDAGGSLYGATVGGGAYHSGVLFSINAAVGKLLPSDFDGTIAPPVGEPNFLLSIDANAPGNSLSIFKFHVDFTDPANSTLTGPTIIPVHSYNEACGGQGTCIPQKGTQQLLESKGDHLMYRLAYRNFGDHEALVTNHSVNPGFTGIAAAERWYEIRDPNGKPSVFQQGTLASKAYNYWMGSIAMDKNGNIALGFSSSSRGTFPNVMYTGRVPTDPLGTMESVVLLQAGGGSQSGGSGPNRWGDYSSMAIDPSDDCTFWYTNEYLKTTGNRPSWDTRIASFKFRSCR